MTAKIALEKLRFMLGQVGVVKAELFRTHDLRRGHARDLQLSGRRVHSTCALCVGISGHWFAGAPLWQILNAGEWRSPAFLEYMDLHRLEGDLVVQAHVDESESEDESDLDSGATATYKCAR